jgi:hypothetical protein
VLLGSRPQFHSAFWVLFWGAFTVPMAWMAVLIRRAFGEDGTVNYELIAFFVGPLGLGALASMSYEFAAGSRASQWVSTAVFGGASAFSFSVLVELKHNASFDAAIAGGVSVGGALIFMLLRWLMLREQGRHVAQ